MCTIPLLSCIANSSPSVRFDGRAPTFGHGCIGHVLEDGHFTSFVDGASKDTKVGDINLGCGGHFVLCGYPRESERERQRGRMERGRLL